MNKDLKILLGVIAFAAAVFSAGGFMVQACNAKFLPAILVPITVFLVLVSVGLLAKEN